MKLIYLITLISFYNSYSQSPAKPTTESIRDYFLGTSDKNETAYWMPDPKSGSRTEIALHIYFLELKDSIKMAEASLFRGSLAAATEQTVLIKNNEVRLHRLNRISISGDQFYKKFLTPIVILKLPQGDKGAIWDYINEHGNKIHCITKFMNLTIDNESRKAILLEKHATNIFSDGRRVESIEKEYYVKGIGLYKKTLSASNFEATTALFDYQKYEPNPPVSKD